jgi:hypothetical protein
MTYSVPVWLDSPSSLQTDFLNTLKSHNSDAYDFRVGKRLFILAETRDRLVSCYMLGSIMTPTSRMNCSILGTARTTFSNFAATDTRFLGFFVFNMVQSYPTI